MAGVGGKWRQLYLNNNLKKFKKRRKKAQEFWHWTGHPAQRDLPHLVNFSYIQLQWQRAILHKHVKVPPAINQSTQVLDHQTATQLLKLAH